ncbi:MAG: competence/damage-inducible protein A [Verrucomicrobia bacterium]|nr:competence/damage-inducible protein A [Verrucomicrobiota bacterium]MCH8511522.1 competence/damage-inducible protein A [Kiritimatiellia bacterium]
MTSPPPRPAGAQTDSPRPCFSAEVIATGAELLQGRTLNRHGYTLGGLLTAFGIPLVRETVLPDDPQRITAVTAEALTRADLVFVTGGLGPTDDDLTREAVAEALGKTVVSDPEADAHLQAYFDRIERQPTPAQRRQAKVIAGARVFMNPVGIAPGQCVTTEDQRHVWLLPGPPRELQGLLESAVQPWLTQLGERPDRHVRLFRILGHSESRVQEAVLAHGVPEGVEIAYCARPGSVELRFTGPQRQLSPMVDWVREHYADDVLNETGEPVEVELGHLLTARKETVATAESCTAGGIAERLTDVPGSSAYVAGGIIAYANEVKIRELGVSEAILAEQGAVSEPVAAQMAAGVREKFNTDWGISITGIAGPGGGSSEKPVGLFYVGTAGKNQVRVTRYQVNGNRAQIRDHGIQRALECLWREVVDRQSLADNPSVRDRDCRATAP